MLLGIPEVEGNNAVQRNSNWNLFRDDYLSAIQTCFTLGFVKEQRPDTLKAKETVAFEASLSSSLRNMKSGQRVVFSTLGENNGNGYDASSGVFTAPGSGVYIFVWSIVSTETRFSSTALIVNGKQRAVNQCNSKKANNDSCTRTTVVKLAVGEKVWIECVQDGSAIDDYKSSSFAGFRL
ncbi:complement C1q tumor necrosis factor-related protein 3-like [Saccostrea echinata]|uniref:complement C1q tumor necrosis factor-related protein 3-like n=1 Tax=Saccostrea echinata TaxID=191078 RepID=UPI002A7EF9A3|nr:complement C1q tumor necrosis factor-related protein 3-like [Saccostrea echinata]